MAFEVQPQLLVQASRRVLREQRLWVRSRWLLKEGLRNAWQRRRIQRLILKTPAIRTSAGGQVEVRILTWQRDWINAIWALKSFYHFARVDYPLYIHDGGLKGAQVNQLRTHFPDATLVLRAHADSQMNAKLEKNGLLKCKEYRLVHPFALKLLDFFYLSTAEYVISIDSDILFFRRPEELLVSNGDCPANRYNRDTGYWYSASVGEIESRFDVTPAPSINAGLSLIRRETIDLNAIEAWLSEGDLFTNAWLAEQTLQAMCAALHDSELLPNSYVVSTEPGLPPDVVCKHYPGFFRPQLYQEGMKHLVRAGFLQAMGTPLQNHAPRQGRFCA
jgi:hypothetical protein